MPLYKRSTTICRNNSSIKMLIQFAVITLIFSQCCRISDAVESSEAVERIIYGDKFCDHRPYFAQITLAWRYLCGGTIISDRAVLTAAECLFSTVLNDYRIYVGSREYMKGTQHRVLNSIVHNKYDAYTHINDIGILITIDLIVFSKGTIEKLPLSYKNAALEDDTNVLVMGFGVEQEDDWGTNSKTLSRVTLKVKSFMDCKAALKRLIASEVLFTDDQFCTIVGLDGKDVCRQDVGGPAVYEGLLVGIVSWGVGCGRKDYPRVYTYIPRYRDWIQENMAPREMINSCTGSSDWTEYFTVLLMIGKSARCACTILSGRSCLTVSTCIPYNDDLKKYSIFHKNKNYRVESVEMGHKINAQWTVEAYDLMIIKYDHIKYEEYYEKPPMLSDDSVKLNYTSGILIKNFYFEGVSANHRYSQNEQVFIDTAYCTMLYVEILPFPLTANHFCVVNRCDPAETKRQICADMDGSVVFNNLGELIGLIVWQAKCHTHHMAVGVFLPKYFSSLKRSAPDLLDD